MTTIAIILLVLGFLFYILDDIIAFVKTLFSGEFIEKASEFLGTEVSKKKMPIKKYIKKELHHEKETFILRSYEEMKENLEYIGDAKNTKTYGIAFIFCGLVGVIIALSIGNLFLIPILGVGGALVPTWIVKLREYNFRKKLNAELSVTLSAITTSYIRSNNIVKAIEENLGNMKKPVKEAFQDFLNRYKYIDKNLKNNIKILSGQFNSKIFKLWCQELIVCQNDNNYKHNLTVVVAQFALDKETQDNLSVKLNTPIKETIYIILITLLLYPLLGFFGNGTVEILSNTFIGQCLSTSLWVVNILAIDRAIRLSAPVE